MSGAARPPPRPPTLLDGQRPLLILFARFVALQRRRTLAPKRRVDRAREDREEADRARAPLASPISVTGLRLLPRGGAEDGEPAGLGRRVEGTRGRGKDGGEGREVVDERGGGGSAEEGELAGGVGEPQVRRSEVERQTAKRHAHGQNKQLATQPYASVGTSLPLTKAATANATPISLTSLTRRASSLIRSRPARLGLTSSGLDLASPLAVAGPAASAMSRCVEGRPEMMWSVSRPDQAAQRVEKSMVSA